MVPAVPTASESCVTPGFLMLSVATDGLVGIVAGDAFRVATRKHSNVIRNPGDFVQRANQSHRGPPGISFTTR
jgi:hypothetical protein